MSSGPEQPSPTAAPPAAATASPARKATAAGRLLGGRYRITGKVGAGGMATILSAYDTRLDRQVAVKVLHAHMADDPEVLGRFRREARHAASLTHPNVVAVFDQGVADLPYIVMELVEGPSLREVLQQHGPLPPAQALAVVEPLCDALARAHERGVIHRDIKPENVLVSTEGVPKLADFGIARAVAATSHTATGTLVGSVHYMAPELVDGHDATPASDQYALAVLLWELLTGRKPLPAETPMQVALRHANEDIPPASRHVPGLPRALDRVLARATHRDPAARYPDVAAFGAALRQAVPTPTEAVTTTGEDGREHTLILPAEAQDTLALDGARRRSGAAADLDERRRRAAPRPARPSRAPAPPRPRRSWGRALAWTLLVLTLLAALGAGGLLMWDRVLAPVREVPDLTGVTRQEAFQRLDELGLDLVVADQRHDLEAPEGTVLSQEPADGSPLRAGGTVSVVLSLGPQVVEMPSVLQLELPEAEEILARDHFEVVVDPDGAHSDTVPAGQILAQAPEPGVPIAQGDTVHVTVSLGVEQVEVPDLTGLTAEEAVAALEAARLVPSVTEEWSDEQPEAGLVAFQSQPPGTMLDHDSTVEVVISRGPLTIAVPNVIGMDVAEARAALEALALQVAEESSPVPTIGPFTLDEPGVVKRQQPGRDAEVQRGDTVTIYYFTAG